MTSKQRRVVPISYDVLDKSISPDEVIPDLNEQVKQLKLYRENKEDKVDLTDESTTTSSSESEF